LEGREWKAAATSIITRLLHSANDTAKVLAVVVNTSEDLRLVNEQAFHETRKALNRTLGLVYSVEHSQHSVAATQEKMHAALSGAMENYAVVADALKQVAAYSSAALQLQGYIVSNMLLLHTAGFYCGIAAIIWFVTSAPRLGDAKVPLFGMLLLSAALETWTLRSSNGYFSPSVPADGVLHTVISSLVEAMSWLLRWFTVFSPDASTTILGAFTPTHAEQCQASETQNAIRGFSVIAMVVYLVYSLITYQNYPKLTQQLLRKVEHLLQDRAAVGEEQNQTNFFLRGYPALSQQAAIPQTRLVAPLQTLLYDTSIKKVGILSIGKLLSSMPLLEAGSKLYQTFGRSMSTNNNAVAGMGVRKRAPCRYNLRTLSSTAAPNPILCNEGPRQFAQLVHLQFVASTLGRYAEITVNPVPSPMGDKPSDETEEGCLGSMLSPEPLTVSGRKRSRQVAAQLLQARSVPGELSSDENPRNKGWLPSTPPTKRPRLVVPTSNE
jgi:hypothetical protein